MIDGQKFFNQPVRNNLIAYDNIRKILTGQGDAYTIDLSKVFEYGHMLLNCVLSIHQKRFFDQSKHYNLLFLEWNIISFVTFIFVLHLQIVKQKVYLLLEKLDQLRNLKIDLLLLLILLLDIYSS